MQTAYPSLTRRLARTSGFTLLEALIDVVILVVVSLAIAMSLRMLSRQTVNAKDRSFATQKAIQILDEMRSVAATAPNENIAALDVFTDTNPNPMLTIKPEAGTNEAHPLSENSGRRYYRKIEVFPVQADAGARVVYVRVYLTKGDQPLAQAVSTLSAARRTHIPTQVFDVYVIAIENIPALGRDMTSLRGEYTSLIEDLLVRNPGLEFRTHFITRLSYGRDFHYTPYINTTTNSGVISAFPWVYLYPGAIAGSPPYYNEELFTGRIRTNVALLNGAIGSAPSTAGYALADQFNHSMRYPDEMEAYNSIIGALPANQGPEISLRMLLEQMNTYDLNSGPRNLLLFNLHGDLIPLPPLRNYSDAAKIPGGTYTVGAPIVTDQRYLRAVTHPQNLSNRATDPVTLRVYPYVMTGVEGVTAVGPNDYPATTTDIINVRVHHGINPLNVSVLKNGDTASYGWAGALGPLELTANYGAVTDFKLLLAPFRHPCPGGNCAAGGLDTAHRLYGLEYIPCEIGLGVAPGFPTNEDMTPAAVNGPRNTARYKIVLAPGTLPVSTSPYKVETWIGSSANPTPPNLSTTWVWISTAIPATERYQFSGDPRHMPYHDVKMYHGYNWFFTDNGMVGATPPYPGFTKVLPGWTTSGGANPGPAIFDVPRYLALYRDGMVHMNGIFHNLSGWSFSHAGFGGEFKIGDSVGGAPVLVQDVPWNPAAANSGTDTTVNELDTLTNAETGMRLIGMYSAGSVQPWVSLPWLGELYPDSEWATWSNAATGGNLETNFNLPAVSYYRANYEDFGPTGAALNYPSFVFAPGPGPAPGTSPTQRLGERGVVSFLNGIPSGGGGSFSHDYAPGGTVSNFTAVGSSVATTFRKNIGAALPFAAPFVFGLNHPFGTAIERQPDEWNDAGYTLSRTTLQRPAIEEYFDSSWNGPGGNYMGNAMIKVTSGTVPNAEIGYYNVAGLSPTTSAPGTTLDGTIMAVGLTTLVRGFMAAGAPTNLSGRPFPVPLVGISTPTVTQTFHSPASINIAWGISWTRWDGEPYTDDYSTSYNAGITLYYNLKWSDDNEISWKFIQAPQGPALPGVLNVTSNYLMPGTATNYLWNTSALPTNKRYQIRIEAYRPGHSQHYTFHTRTVYIEP